MKGRTNSAAYAIAALYVYHRQRSGFRPSLWSTTEPQPLKRSGDGPNTGASPLKQPPGKRRDEHQLDEQPRDGFDRGDDSYGVSQADG